MGLMYGSVAFLLALLCAATMGLAIQRGTTCTVAAVEELLKQRRATRLLAILEASVWVGAGLLLARHFGVITDLPTGHALTRWTFIGASLLGLGAVVNGACVFGVVARVGSGEWAFAATPIGFYVGCITVSSLFAMPPSPAFGGASPLAAVPVWLAWLFIALSVLRWARAVWQHGVAIRTHWSPHAATAVIGLAFLGLLLLAGGWAYTDVLADLAHDMAHNLSARLWLVAALFLGAVAGGWASGRWRPLAPAPKASVRCFVGGVMMGWGGMLVPGGNDGLILLGMPMLWPYAWAAFATMGAVVAGALWLIQSRAPV